MRELTENEKKTIRILIEKYHPSGINLIGEVLLGVHQIRGMKRVELEKEEVEYQKVHKTDVRRVEISYYRHEDRNFTSEFYESILLLEFLIENRYIAYNKVIDMQEIGDNTVSPAQLIDNIKVEGHLTGSNFFNASQTDLWNLLSSTYIITNNLKDYVEHDFKTQEQIKFKKQRKDTWIGIGAALVIGITGIVLNIYALKKDTNINKEQIKSIQTTIRENKVTIPNDTLKVNMINPPTTSTNHDQEK